MKLIRAAYWYFIQSLTHPEAAYVKGQVVKLALSLLLAIAGLLFFLVAGIVQGDENQIWGCSFGLLAALFPISILSKSLLGVYDEYYKGNEKV
jgi:hypothetical protein